MIDTHSHDIHTHTCLHKHALMYIHNTRQRQTARTPEKSLPALAGIHPQPQTQRCCQCTVYQCVVPPHTTHKVTGKHTHTHTCTHTLTHTHTHTRTHTCTHTHTSNNIYARMRVYKHTLCMYTRQSHTARTPEKLPLDLAGTHPQPQTRRCCLSCLPPPHRRSVVQTVRLLVERCWRRGIRGR